LDSRYCETYPKINDNNLTNTKTPIKQLWHSSNV